MTEEQIQRKAEIASFSRKELNAHAFHLEQEQNDYEFIIRTLQQQNKQLIEALEEIKDEEWRLAGEFTTIYTTAYYALQQIQGNK